MLFSILSKFLILAAVVLIAGAVYGYISVQNSLKNSDIIEATITSVDTLSSQNPEHPRVPNNRTSNDIDWVTTLSYRFQGKNYLEKDPITYSYENEPKVGGKVKIHVNRDDPKRFYINEFSRLYGLPATLAFFAFICLFIGLPVHFLIVKDPFFNGPPVQFLPEKSRNLDVTGKLIRATVIKIDKSIQPSLGSDLSDGAKKFLEKTGVDPWTVHAEWHSPDDGKMYSFQSFGLNKDPKLNEGDKVDVYLDRKNPMIYEMDVKPGAYSRY